MRQRRTTRQREAIRTAIARAGRPLAPQEVLDRAKDSVPTLGIATVYRTLTLLVEEGHAAAVEFPNGPLRYEATGKGHHHHFLCTSCERVWDVEGCPGGIRELTPTGFEFDAHELTLYGRCERCAA